MRITNNRHSGLNVKFFDRKAHLRVALPGRGRYWRSKPHPWWFYSNSRHCFTVQSGPVEFWWKKDL